MERTNGGPRGAEASPPASRRRAARLASEPTSRHVRRTDRWEVGFLRLPAGSQAHPPSYVVDGIGIYYDATSPSALEILLEDGGWEGPELAARAERGLAALRRHRISLDNDPRRAPLKPSGPGPCIVVVDQPRGDPSVGFGLAGEQRFLAMLEAAAAEHPGAEIVVVMDPAAALTDAPGHLAEAAAGRGARLVGEPVEAWSVVEACAHLYTVSAHLGFEAAAAGRPVTCFGVPFYAGWGFTDDRLALDRRTRRRSVQEVFAAAYLLYSRYFDPFGGAPCRFEDALDSLALMVARDRENAVPTLCLGFAAWKRGWLERVLGAPGSSPRVSEASQVRAAEIGDAKRVVAWASRAPEGTEAACAAAGVPLLRMEDGFLRSVGLGVALRPGASYVLDRSGVYYDAGRESDLETLLREAEFPPALTERAARLRAQIVAARLSKYNVGAAPLPALPKGRPLVLVAGQVEDDASIRLGAPTVAGNAGLLRAARARNPGAVIAYKPHPDVEAGLRPGRIPPAELADLADVVLNDVAAPDAIEAADRVEVATSLLGFEALLRGKPVATYGLPFYAGWGLTESPDCARRGRTLTLDELVAAVLILYPRYVDPRTGLACSPEVLVRRLGERDPGLARREPTLEALLKGTWSLIWRRLLRRTG